MWRDMSAGKILSFFGGSMSTRNCFLFLLLLFVTTSSFAQGTLIEDSFWFEPMLENQMVNVYLPEGYNANDTETIYPVIYFLHGGGSSHHGYSNVQDAADLFYEGHQLTPIIVKPNGGPSSWFTDSQEYGPIELLISTALVEYIDQTYNTIASADKRFLMGHSMGGHGSFRIAMKYPETFCGAASHGGTLNMRTFVEIEAPLVLGENGGSGPFVPSAGNWSTSLFNSSKAFSPNPDNPPYYVDLPIDNDGVIIESVMDVWNLNNPATLVTAMTEENRIHIFFDSGDDDIWHPVSESFNDIMTGLTFPYTYLPYDGGHMSELPERYPYAFAFIDSIFWSNTGVLLSTELSSTNYNSETDNITVTSLISNPEEHTITVNALIKDEGNNIVTTMEMFDNGENGDGEPNDGVWGNLIDVSAFSGTYSVNIEIENTVSEETTYYGGQSWLTDLGPVVIDHVVTSTGDVINPGEMPGLMFYFRNDSETETLTNMHAEVLCDNEYITFLVVNSQDFDDMAPGEVVSLPTDVFVGISADCPDQTDIIADVLISSAGRVLWETTHTIHIGTVSVDDSEDVNIPESFDLIGCYPNPFNPTTSVKVSVSYASIINVNVYDIMGRRVTSLCNTNLNAGSHSLVWDASNNAAGIYFVNMTAPGFQKVQKVTLLK
jgi:S-formylglutathione hydrolase FrmB